MLRDFWRGPAVSLGLASIILAAGALARADDPNPVPAAAAPSAATSRSAATSPSAAPMPQIRSSRDPLLQSGQIDQAIQTLQAQLEQLEHAKRMAGVREVQSVTNMNGKYWLGLMCEPVPAEIRSYVDDIPKDAGLFVLQVIKDSPAAKGGVHENDILIKANGDPLATNADLLEKVNEAKDEKPIRVMVFRAHRVGKAEQPVIETVELQLTPAARPDRERNIVIKEGGGDGIQIKIPDNDGAPGAENPRANNLQFKVVGPGMIMTRAKLSLPDDTKVTIVREGNKPAHITVKQGEQTWEADDNDLSKLPENIRNLLMKLSFSSLINVQPLGGGNLQPQGGAIPGGVRAGAANPGPGGGLQPANPFQPGGPQQLGGPQQPAGQGNNPPRPAIVPIPGGAGNAQINGGFRMGGNGAANPWVPNGMGNIQLQQGAQRDLNDRFEKLDRRLDELQKTLEAMRDDSSRPARRVLEPKEPDATQHRVREPNRPASEDRAPRDLDNNDNRPRHPDAEGRRLDR